MSLLLLLLPLGLGLSLASAQELSLQSVVHGNYDLDKVGQAAFRAPDCPPQPGFLACSRACS